MIVVILVEYVVAKSKRVKCLALMEISFIALSSEERKTDVNSIQKSIRKCKEFCKKEYLKNFSPSKTEIKYSKD